MNSVSNRSRKKINKNAGGIFDNFFLIHRMDDKISMARISTLARHFDVSIVSRPADDRKAQ